MKELLYKEFKLAIHPLYYIVPLLGALVLIPEWIYFLALMYFFFITVPNVFSNAKAQNDIGFSVLMPVRKRDVVKARILAMTILELVQIIVTAAFCAINLSLFEHQNFLLDANAAFIGFCFVMYAIFNIAFFPMFYKTAYKIGLPVIVGMTASVVFAVAVEAALLLIPAGRILDSRQINIEQIVVLLLGMIIFGLVTYLAYRISARRFERIDL